MHGKHRRWLAFLAFGMLLFSMLACGGFQVRVTPPASATPKPRPTGTVAVSEPTVAPTAEQVAVAGAPTATAAPTAAPAAGGVLTPGAKARVAVDMVNVRKEAKASGARVGTLTKDTVVTVTGGPANADNFTWYEVDNGSGMKGWVASGTADSPWLVASTGTGGPAPAPTSSGPHPVNRAIKVGDLVQVTVQQTQLLTIRENAGKNATAVAKVQPGTMFTVKGGPTQADNLTWWQVEGEQVKGWAVDGDGQDRWLTPMEQ